MVHSLLDTFSRYEPVWLFIVLVAELWYSIQIHKMAKIEFEYDKEWNEKMAAREARRKERAKPLDKEMD